MPKRRLHFLSAFDYEPLQERMRFFYGITTRWRLFMSGRDQTYLSLGACSAVVDQYSSTSYYFAAIVAG